MHNLQELRLPPGAFSSWNDEEYVLDYCPFCNGDKKFVYNVRKTVGRCWVCPRFVTTYKGLLNAIKNPEDIEDVSFFKTPMRHPKTSHTNLCNAWDHWKSKDFLLSRGINELTARQENITYDPKLNTAYMEVTSISPDLPDSCLWRQLTPTGKWLFRKGTKAIYYAWGWEKFVNSQKKVLLTEGIFDLLTTGLHPKGIALLGSSPNKIKFHWLRKNVSGVVVWMDADAAGYKANSYFEEVCDYFNIPCKIFLAEKDPKRYNRKIGSDRRVLEEVESLLE